LGLMPYKAGPGGHKPRHKEKRNTFKMHNRLGALTQPRGTKLLARMARVARPRCRRVPLTPIFGSGVGMVDLLAPTYNALGRPPLESRTCSTAALPGASCPSPPDVGFEMEHSSLRISLLFFSEGAVGLVDARFTNRPGCRHLLLSLARAQGGARTSLATDVIRSGDLHAVGHISDLSHCDINIV
jgi:hypothetical protein